MKGLLKNLWVTKKIQVIAACVMTTAAVGAGVSIPFLLNGNSTETVVETAEDSVILAEEEKQDTEESLALESETALETEAEDETAEAVVEEESQETVVANNNNKKKEENNDKPQGSEPAKEQPSSQNPEEEVLYHTVNFVTNSESVIPAKQIADQTALDNLPNAKKLNSIFDGWFYEEKLSTPVQSTDVITKDLTLYAKYSDGTDITARETASAIIRNDVEADFWIGIVSTVPYDLETAKQLVTVESLFNPEAQAMKMTQREDGVYILSFAEGGFEAGASYKVTLANETLFFDGENPDVREYNFTTSATPIKNMKYLEDVIYLGVDEFSDIVINGKPAEKFSISLFSIYQNGQQITSEETTGSFKSAALLKNGSVVTLYDGIRPDLRTTDSPIEECGDVAYVEITGYDPATSTYYFKKAEAENVIFIPDMLPLNIDSGDVVRDGDRLVIKKSALDFHNDSFAAIGLDSQTTVDQGDFFVLYQGEFDFTNTSAVTYVEILAVEGTEDEYTVKISDNKDWDYVSAAMDVYNSQNQDLSENLDEEMVARIERNAEEQAVSSGFAEEAGRYLASLTLATDTFSTLKSDLDLDDYRVLMEDGTPLMPEQVQLMAKGAKVEVSKPKVKANLSTNLQEFENVSGLRLTLSISTVITIHCNDESDVKIEITGDFVQEMRLDLGFKAKAVWKVWGIFPYIAEYRINVDVDLYDYTGISIRADITTNEAKPKDEDKEKKKEEDPAKKFFNTAAKSLAGELKKLIQTFNSEDDMSGEDEISISTSLTEKYKDMLENESDWVELYSVPILKMTTMVPPCLPIIALEFEADFVISANANVSLGFDFYYKNAKRYSYTIDLFARTVSNNVINLVEEQYELDAYVMGTLGMRAGIRLELKIGVFSTDLASVGFNIEAGAYLKLYGYFFYNLSYTASEGRKQSYSGAMYIEMGMYLEIGVEAQVLGGKYSTEATLFEKEWPLLCVGRQENVLDFISPQEEYEDIKLKQYIKQAVLPDSYFTMNYLDLKEGDDEVKVFSDNVEDGDFTIKITNDKFAYDYKTNMLTVTPAEGDVKVKGEMIITWKSGPLAFTSTAIQRTIKLSWDNLRDGYVIVPYTDGGSYVPIIMKEYGESITVPENPVKPGYVFAGWYRDEEYKVPYTFPEKMGNEDTNIYAKWEEATDTRYRVRFYQQKVDSDEYTLVKTVEGTGRTNSTVTPAVDVYEGYNTPAAESMVILADGSAILNYYYTRVIKHVTFTPGIVSGEDDVYEYKYGAKVSAPIFATNGYIFKGWNKEVEPTMGATDVIYVAQWETAKDTKYRAEYYIQDAEGAYRLVDTVFAEGETDSEITLESLDRSDISENEDVTLESITVNGVDMLELAKNPTIAADGKTVIKVYYGREKVNVAFVSNAEEGNITDSFYVGQKITYPKVYKEGYLLDGWYTDPEFKTPVAEDLTAFAGLMVYAKWEEKASLVIKHFVMNTAGAYEETPVRVQSVDALRGESYEIKDMIAADLPVQGGIEFASAKVAGEDAQVAVIAHEGKNEIALYYKRLQYNLSWIFGDGIGTGEYSADGAYYYDQPITAPIPEKHGFLYDFDIVPPAKMPAGDLTITVIWTETDKMSVKIVDFDNRVLSEQIGYVGDPVEEPKLEINRPGYEFAGFDKEVPEVFGETNVTVKVLYEIITYGIEFDLKGGAFKDSDVPATEYTVESENILLPTPGRRGYTFAGWYENEDFSGEVVTQIAKGSTGDKKFCAKWTENRYTIRLLAPDAENADSVDMDTQATMNLGYDEVVNLIANPYTKTNYVLKGWATTEGGEAVYGDRAEISKLCDQDGDEITLYAVFLRGYHIYYNNLGDGVMAEGITTFISPLSSDMTLDVPKTNKTGYSFAGWYTKEDYSDSSAISTITPSTVQSDVVVYAKWTANPYSVIFDANLKSGTGEETQVFTYDVKQSLKSFAELNFVNPGYSFAGWTTEQNSGRVDYADGAEVQNLANRGSIRLYAVWTAVEYMISYNNWNSVASGNSNATSLYVTSDDIQLVAPTGIHEGYKFLGWYTTVNGVETKVSTIQKGTHENVVLTAKWSYAGSFSISYVSTTGNGVSTYKITRTIPEGFEVDSETQNVYYRTENGTAIGGTAANLNFGHVGGPDVFVVFTSEDGNGSYKTFKVSGENSQSVFNSSKTDAQYAGKVIRSGTAQKYYTVRIYKILNAQGGATGEIDAKNQSYKRFIPENCETIRAGDYNSHKISNVNRTGGADITIESSSYDKNWSFETGLNKNGVIKNCFPGYGDAARGYLEKTTDMYYYSFYMKMKEVNDGYQWVKFQAGDTYICYKFSDETDSGTWTDVKAPCGYTQGANGKVSAFTSEERHTTDYAMSDNLQGEYVNINPKLATSVKVSFDASGAASDDWKISAVFDAVELKDTTAAKQIGIAPLAYGEYKAGDTFILPVVFNEVISGCPNLPYNIITRVRNLGIPAQNVTLLNSFGTNVVCLEVTLESDMKVDLDSTNLNDKLYNNTSLLDGYAKDLLGN